MKLNTNTYKNVLYTFYNNAYYLLRIQKNKEGNLELIPIWFKTENLVKKYIDKFEKRFR